MSDTNGQGHNNSGGQLGQIVSWEVPSEVSLPKLRSALAKAGLGQELAADMAPRNALSRALREMKAGRVIRKLRVEGDVLWFQFTAEHLSQREVTYNKEAELALNMQTSRVTSTVPELAREAQQLLLQHMQKRLTSDLTRLVQRIFDSRRADLIPIRQQGGAYFVPDMHKEIVEKARTLLREIGGSLRTFSVRLGSGDTNAAVADSLFDYMKGMLKEYRESLEGVTKETRKDVVDRRMKEHQEILRKVECYKTLLGGLAEKLTTEAAEGKKVLMEHLTRSPEAELVCA